MKKAIVIGATGLVGSNLIQLLLNETDYIQIDSFSRKPLGLIHPKLTEHIVDFNKIDEWKNKITGDVLFSAMGTTLKKAGSKKAQYQIDYTYQYEFAKAAADNKVRSYVLVSAAMADSKSAIFYSRIKGELENAVKLLPFEKIRILRPGLIFGKREDNRPAETMTVPILKFFSILPGLKKWKPIAGIDVAKAMINAENSDQPALKSYTLIEVIHLAGNK